MGKGKKTKTDDKPKEKKVGIFDIISYLTYDKKPWDKLTVEEKKMFEPYMINRFLSMDLFLVEAINELQKYTLSAMDKKDVYTLYYNLLPSQKFYLKYVKPNIEIPDSDLKLLCKYYNISIREAEDYYLILNKDDIGREKLQWIKDSYIYDNSKK